MIFWIANYLFHLINGSSKPFSFEGIESLIKIFALRQLFIAQCSHNLPGNDHRDQVFAEITIKYFIFDLRVNLNTLQYLL